MVRLAILVSGSGTNMHAILEAADRQALGPARPVLVVADRPCVAQENAQAAGIDTHLVSRKDGTALMGRRLAALFREKDIDLVALAGWLTILPADLTRSWSGRILNIHPSLLPRHGGRGMYGLRVHQAVLDAGDTQSGCSVHQVEDGVDTGKVLSQRTVPVLPGDTAKTLAARVLEQEHALYPEMIAQAAWLLESSMAAPATSESISTP